MPTLAPTARTATDIVADIATGKTTALEVLEAHLSIIDAHEPNVRAWAFVNRDEALAQARARVVGANGTPGALHGVPFGLKDNIDTYDMPTAQGTALYDGHRPARDAACAASLRLAGGIALGKTVCTEFAHRAPGATRNPHDPEHTPGGSSSGSAAAVACGMVPIALGTQTTGSVIRPAAFCGVIGYKPTWGEFNVSGVMANTPSFDTLGVMARSVADVVLVRRALLDASIPALEAAAVGALRIGVCRSPYWAQADAEAHAVIEDVAAQLARGGASIIDVDGNGAFDDLDTASAALSGYEFARTLAHERRVAYEQLSVVLREGRMADGLRVDYASAVSAARRIERARLQMDAVFDDVDVLLTPPAPGAAPRGLDSTGSAVFNMAWTTLHTPAITVPVRNAANGLPLGVQLVGKRHHDDRLLGIAAAVLDRLTR